MISPIIIQKTKRQIKEILEELLENIPNVKIVDNSASRLKLNIESFSSGEALEEVLDDLTQEGHVSLILINSF